MKKLLWLALGVCALGLVASPAWATAACCLDDGSCLTTTWQQCADLGGILATEETPCEQWVCPQDNGPACRVTGGGVNEFDQWDGSMSDATCPPGAHGQSLDRYTFGGQAGAPTAQQPQPYGEWTHHAQRGPQGRFVFHAGTASAPPGTEIDFITCSDPGWCVQARPAPAKQIDFQGIGTFKNIQTSTPALSSVIAGVTQHWFTVHIEDLGEPGKSGKQFKPGSQCPDAGSAGALADCSCPDFYHITIYESGPGSAVIYEVYGYIDGGNLQIHPEVGTSYP